MLAAFLGLYVFTNERPFGWSGGAAVGPKSAGIHYSGRETAAAGLSLQTTTGPDGDHRCLFT